MPPRRTRRTRRTRAKPSTSPQSTTSPPTPPSTSPPRGEESFFTSTPGHHFTRGLMDDPEGAIYIEADFQAIGFSEKKIKTLMAVKEPAVDHFAQRPNGGYARAKEEAAKRLERFLRKRERGSVGGEGRRGGARAAFGQRDLKGGAGGKKGVQVFVDDAQRWVLFDPIRGWPPTLERDPPPIYKRLAQYKPGNSKVVVYNLESYAVALKKTPRMFDGMSVQYAKTGPKLVKVKRE